MRRVACQLLCGFSLCAAQAGCMSISTSLTPDAPGAASTKEAKLPPKKNVEICLNLAGDFERTGHFADAITQYEKARQLDPKLKHLSRRLAVLYDRLGEERKALEEYAIALKQAPKDADLLNDLGYCHYNRGRWAEAEKHYREALAVNPKHSRATINLGLTLAHQGKPDDAMKEFLKVNRPAEAKANLAFVAAAHGKKDLARKLYKEALAEEPALVAAQNGLASLDTPPKDPNVKQASATKKVAEVSQKPADPLPDMSPITIGPKR